MALPYVSLLAAEVGESDSSGAVMIIVIALVALIAFISVIVLMLYGKLWFRAYMSGAYVRMLSLIGMTFRQVNPRVIVEANIMAVQAGVGSDPADRHYDRSPRSALPRTG